MLRFVFDNTGSQHDDLILQLDSFLKRGNSYYLALDRKLDKDDESPAKVRKVVRSMLAQWHQAILAAGTENLYLLAHLDDESTTWLMVTFKSDDVVVKVMWSTLEGYRIWPSQDAARTSEPPNLAPVTRGKKMSRQTILDDISRCLRMLSSQDQPVTDPTPIFEHYRGAYGTQLLTAAVSHFQLFDHLSSGVKSRAELQSLLALADRPFTVLTTALKAMGLIDENDAREFSLTPLASEHLVTRGKFDVSDYLRLSAESPDVQGMIRRLTTNRPAGAEDDTGTAFIFRDGVRSAMDQAESARFLTRSLAGRARNVAPRLPDAYSLRTAETLLDLGGGSGLYSIAYLARHPGLKAIVFDRPEVLPVAAECAIEFGVEDRLELVPGDMFRDPLPAADAVLLSNILHDWDVPECRTLVTKCVEALPVGGTLLIHDVFLNDALDGPLPIALYSAALFTLTEGRAYSVKEYTEWLEDAGLTVSGPVETLIHCGLLIGQKPG
jgi:hypothetical protein